MLTSLIIGARGQSRTDLICRKGDGCESLARRPGDAEGETRHIETKGLVARPEAQNAGPEMSQGTLHVWIRRQWKRDKTPVCEEPGRVRGRINASLM